MALGFITVDFPTEPELHKKILSMAIAQLVKKMRRYYLQNVSYVDNESTWKGFNRNPHPIFPYLETFHFIDLKEYSEAHCIRMRGYAND